MTQIISSIILLIVGALLGFGLGGHFKSNPTIEATPAVIGKITDLAELVVLRVPVSKVHVTTLGGYVGSVSCVVLVHGELELGTDMKLAEFTHIDTDARTATLRLAEPKVRRARLDHSQTSVYRIDRGGLWKGVPPAESAKKIVNLALIESQNCIEDAGDELQYVDRAKRHTEQVLSQFLQALGWEVTLVWGEKLDQDTG